MDQNTEPAETPGRRTSISTGRPDVRAQRRRGGYRIETSRALADALLSSGWRAASVFDAECSACSGSGERMGGYECSCGGLLWVPPEVVPSG